MQRNLVSVLWSILLAGFHSHRGRLMAILEARKQGFSGTPIGDLPQRTGYASAMAMAVVTMACSCYGHSSTPGTTIYFRRPRSELPLDTRYSRGPRYMQAVKSISFGVTVVPGLAINGFPFVSKLVVFVGGAQSPTPPLDGVKALAPIE